MTSPTAAVRCYEVLLLAYLCSPNHGSEAKIGWNFAVGTAKRASGSSRLGDGRALATWFAT